MTEVDIPYLENVYEELFQCYKLQQLRARKCTALLREKITSSVATGPLDRLASPPTRKIST